MMGTSGRCGVVPENIQIGIMDSHLLRMRVNEKILSDFLRLLIDEADYVYHQIRVAGKGSIMHGLNSSIVRNLAIALPPISEQQTIAAFFDRETAKLGTLTTEAQTAISLLQEHRAALISAAVTGKIDVRGLVPAKPELKSETVPC